MTRRRAERGRWAAALGLAAGVAAAQAQSAGGPTGSSVQTYFSAMGTWTDNLRLSERDKDAAFITTLSPGVRITSNSGAVRGSLNYTLNGIAYFKTDEASQLQNSLQANGQVELVPRSLYVDVQASIGQQSASAFGLQSAPTLGSQGSVSTLVDTNRREVGTLTISPLWRGIVGNLASFELRGNFTRTEVRGDDLGDSRGSGGSVRFTGLNTGRFNWWAMASTQQTQQTGVRGNRLSSVMVGVNYQPLVDWTLSANVGQERNNYLTTDAQSSATGGVNLQWTPTPRTRINGDWQHHDYGDSHSLGIEHRLSRAVLRLSDSQSVMAANASGNLGLRTNYDLYYLMFASLEPDPVKRDALVRTFLASLGLPLDAPSGTGFLSSGPTQMRSQLASVAVQGVRTTLSAQANRSVTRQLAPGLNQGDLANATRIEQLSYSLSASYQLSPNAGITLIASRLETRGDASGQATGLTSFTANWNGKLGPRLGLQFGGRHSRFGGLTAYSENAVYANLTQQF